jgi:GNAT superfamily N-acetyltransferase
MPMQFEFDPPLPTAETDTFVQNVRLVDDGRLLGSARWVAPAATIGTVQLIELHVDPAVRRAGHGRRLMQQLIAQAVSLHTARKTHLRRIWAGVGHKSQVIGRSFLTGEGFHHVGSSGGLLGDEDLLIYVRALR